MIASHPLEPDACRHRYQLTNDKDQELVRDELANADAVITSASSIRAEGSAPVLTNQSGKPLIWVVYTSKGLAADLPFLSQSGLEKWIVSEKQQFSSPPTSQFDNNHYMHYGSACPAQFVYDRLKQQNVKRVLLFGGGQINQMFFEAGLVNEIKLTISPLIISQVGASPWIASGTSGLLNLSLLSSQAHGSHVFLHYKVHKQLR